MISGTEPTRLLEATTDTLIHSLSNVGLITITLIKLFAELLVGTLYQT